MSTFWKILVGIVLAQGAVFAQLTPPVQEPIAGARMPALSPDGKDLAFVYRGDIWVASAKGGHATPLTQHVETDAYPLYSPDGKWVAFSSKRNGNWDIFVIPAEGGRAKQLTWHSGAEIAHGWSPDGKQLVFGAKRDSPNYALYALDVSDLHAEVLCEDFAPLNYASYSPDGKRLVYTRYGFPWSRPRYQGSAAAHVWMMDLTSNDHRWEFSTNEFQHLWTRFLPDGKYFVSVTVGEATPSSSPLDAPIGPVEDNPKRTPNLWKFDLAGNAKQLTTFTGGSVRCPTVAGKSGDIAFEYGPDLWFMKDGKGKPAKIKLFVASDEKQTTHRREKVTSGVTEAEPSPDGKTFAFSVRGDIWTVAINKPKGVAGRNAEFARRLTDWVGDDSDFSWSPDGEKLYFTSDREFTTRVYEIELDTLETKSLWNHNENVTGLRVSPDGKELGFWVAGKEGGLYMLDLESGQSRRVVKVPGPHWNGIGGGDFAWSPDMKWIAYTFRGESRAWNIWVVPTEGGDPINVTRLYARHGHPTWSPDGKYLFFQSNRDGDGLYVLPLKGESVRTADTDIKFEKPTNSVAVEIDFEDISRRIRKVASQDPQSDLVITRDGLILFVSDGEIYSVTYDGKETKKLTSGGGKFQLRINKEGTKAFFVQNGELYTMNVDSKGTEKVAFTAEWERDVRAERRAAFTQFWRSYERGFYDANFHGRNWSAIRGRYEPLLEAVETHDEFAALLQMMVGELECSHSEITPVASSTPSPVTPHLGFTFDYKHSGPGIKVGKVPFGSPAWYSRTQIHEGEYVLAINGKDVNLDEKLYEWINDKQDREFEFLVSTNTSKSDARKVKYKVLTQDEWTDLNYKNRIERLRKYVEDRSDGRIGYLHLSAMGYSNQTRFEREAYEYIVGKDAMIIDVRFNGGGNIADTLIDWLERKPHGYVRPRDAEREPSPHHAWEKPIVVLMNEHSYSNAEIFPNAMRTRGLAKLVGMPTPGYVIWTDSMKLVDGTGARMPQSGAYRIDGTAEENNGEQPDVRVPMTPDDWLAERDPQLDKAVEMLVTPSGAVTAAPAE
ncbi:MAG TPA: S41 family peptidase [Candidatus Binatia bacterium]|nr:S41 family peptidase [Candidatus Binatia bacterium]